MKHFLSTLLVASTAILFAGEPFLLNTPGSEFPKSAKVTGKKMQANMEGQSNIVIKMSISQRVLKTLAFQAQYGFHRNLSVALEYHLFLARPLPGFFGGEDPTGQGLRNTRLGGWSITPEFRF